MKITLLEGGVRGSAPIYSTLVEQKHYINNNLMHLTDLYATLLNLAGKESFGWNAVELTLCIAGGDKSLFETHTLIY